MGVRNISGLNVTAVDIRDRFLEPLRAFFSVVAGGYFTPDYGLGLSVGASIQLGRGKELNVMFYDGGQARIIIMAGLAGHKDEAGSWKEIAYALLNYVDFHVRLSCPEHVAYRSLLLEKLRELARQF